MADDLEVALLALAHEERIVLGYCLVHRHRGLDPVLVQDLEHPEDPDTVAILVL